MLYNNITAATFGQFPRTYCLNVYAAAKDRLRELPIVMGLCGNVTDPLFNDATRGPPVNECSG